MASVAELVDEVNIMNFTLTRGLSKTIRGTFEYADSDLDISEWDFELAFYIGPDSERTVILSSVDGGIVVDDIDLTIDLLFTGASFESVPLGKTPWDLRFLISGNGTQLLKGIVNIARI